MGLFIDNSTFLQGCHSCSPAAERIGVNVELQSAPLPSHVAKKSKHSDNKSEKITKQQTQTSAIVFTKCLLQLQIPEHKSNVDNFVKNNTNVILNGWVWTEPQTMITLLNMILSDTVHRQQPLFCLAAVLLLWEVLGLITHPPHAQTLIGLSRSAAAPFYITFLSFSVGNERIL